PQNLAAHWAEGEVVPIVLFLVLVGIAFNKLNQEYAEQVAPFKAFIDAGNHVMGMVVNIVISFTPYAVLSLIARAVSRSTLSDLLPLLSVLVLTYLLCATQVFGVESVLRRIIGELSPLACLRKLGPAAVVGFTSQSS